VVLAVVPVDEDRVASFGSSGMSCLALFPSVLFLPWVMPFGVARRLSSLSLPCCGGLGYYCLVFDILAAWRVALHSLVGRRVRGRAGIGGKADSRCLFCWQARLDTLIAQLCSYQRRGGRERARLRCVYIYENEEEGIWGSRLQTRTQREVTSAI
jgi:hypothetical protein